MIMQIVISGIQIKAGTVGTTNLVELGSRVVDFHHTNEHTF